MKNTIFKMVDDIIAEELLAVFDLCDKSNYGDVFDLDTFEHYNDCKCITDYDGSGCMIFDGKLVNNSVVWCFNKSVLINKQYILPYSSLRELFGDMVEIIWYNK